MRMKAIALVAAFLMILSFYGCQQGASDPQLDQEQTAPEQEEGVVLVSDVQQLQDAFSRLKTDDVIQLTADIDMTGQSLSVVNTRGFTLDGNGHTISNYCVQDQSGLFVDNGGNRCYTFKNLTLKNCSVDSGDEFAALFIGAARDSDTVTISNCHAVDCTVTGQKYAAIFVSYTSATAKADGQPVTMTVEACSATGCSVTGGGSTGIAIAHSGGNDSTVNIIKNLTIQDCTITGEDALHEGIVIGTAGTGRTEISGIEVDNVTTAYNQEEGIRRYFGRNLTELLIDGQEQEKTNS